MRPESGVAGQCEMPPVPTSAMRSGTASQARRSAAPNAQARFSGVSGGPWQLMLAGITGRSKRGVRKCSGTMMPWSNFHSSAKATSTSFMTSTIRRRDRSALPGMRVRAMPSQAGSSIGPS